MEVLIKKLELLYSEEINKAIKKFSKVSGIKETSEYYGELGSDITEIFHLTTLKEYDEYIGILNEIEVYDKKLAQELENYLMKEMNLIALLGFHLAANKGIISETIPEFLS